MIIILIITIMLMMIVIILKIIIILIVTIMPIMIVLILKIIMIIIIILIITIIGFSSGHCTQWLFSVHSFQINLEFGSWFFCGGGKTGGLRENLGVRSRTNT